MKYRRFPRNSRSVIAKKTPTGYSGNARFCGSVRNAGINWLIATWSGESNGEGKMGM